MSERRPPTIDSTVDRRTLLQVAASGSLAVTGLAAFGRGAAFAQDATPAAEGAPPLPAGATLVASGLINPRFIAIAADGSLYVTESGTGGDEELIAPGGDAGTAVVGSPEAAAPIGNRGTSGQVTRISPDGTATVVATGLPSYAFGFESAGAAGIQVGPDGMLWVAIGGSGPATAFLDALPNENSVVSIDPATGTIATVADIGAYERANNPHPTAVDSNLYGISLGADGTLTVADAGGNTVYTVDPATGELTVLAVIDDIPLPEGAQGPPTLEAVPTGVAQNPTGGVYVGLLSGGPFPAGAAKVLAIAAEGTVSDAATGLTMVVDVAVGPDGALYASQISTNFLTNPPAPGNVVRILEDGTQEIVADGIFLPNGIVFDDDGNLFVVAGALGPGGPAGMVLRFDAVAPPASS
jgi:sugar lactone lactonase YvrE